MRRSTTVFTVLGLALASVMVAFAAVPSAGGSTPFDTSGYRPQVVFHEMETAVDGQYVTISGVVFSRSPIDRVTIGERMASIRPAEPKDLVKLKRVPDGATDAPFRTFFEVPDAGLQKLGANDLEVRAMSADGRVSDLHRVTVIKVSQPGA